MNEDLALLVLRLAVGIVVIPHGLMKIGWVGSGGSIAGTGGWFQSIGLRPGIFWALVATTAESVGGLLTILGLGGPLGPGILAGDLLVVTIVAHWSKGFWAGKGGWEFPVPLTAGAFAIALLGNGSWSLDALIGFAFPGELLWPWLGLVAAGALLALVARAVFAPRTKPV